MIIESPRQTNAEGLLYTVTCSVTNIIVKVCRQTPTTGGTTTAPTQTEPSTPPTSSAPQTSPTTSSSPVVTETTPPLEVSQPLNAELPPVPKVGSSTVASTNYQYPSSALLSIYGTQVTTQAVLGASSTGTVLEASPQGWRLFGMAWYWWILMIGGVVGLAAFVRNRMIKSFLSIVK